jgi:hypothetical protein
MEEKTTSSPASSEPSASEGSHDISIATNLISSESSALEEAKKKIAELDKLNAELEAKMKRADTLMAESMLRGRSFAGQPNRIETEEEKIKREMKEYFKGTAVGDCIK